VRVVSFRFARLFLIGISSCLWAWALMLLPLGTDEHIIGSLLVTCPLVQGQPNAGQSRVTRPAGIHSRSFSLLSTKAKDLYPLLYWF
jgi:hypothetical protein